MQKATKGDPKRQAFHTTLLRAFSAARPANERFEMFADWKKYEFADHPTRKHEVVTIVDGKEVRKTVPIRVPVLVPDKGRIEVWRLGGEKPTGAMTDVQADGTWYGLEAVVPHALSNAEAKAVMEAMFAKFGV